MDKRLEKAALAILFAVWYLVIWAVAASWAAGAGWIIILGPAIPAAIVTYGVYRKWQK